MLKLAILFRLRHTHRDPFDFHGLGIEAHLVERESAEIRLIEL